MDLVIVGYLLHDVLDFVDKKLEALGGSAAYAGLAGKKLGMNVGIVSKVGEEFKYWKELRGIDSKGVRKQKQTTIFHNIYRDDSRAQKVYNIGEKITIKDVPDEYLKAKAFFIGPVINEMDISVFEFLKDNDILVFLDPQGFMRENKNNEVVKKDLDWTILKYVDIVKFSERDVSLTPEKIKDKSPCPVTIVTQSIKGSLLFNNEKEIHIPAFHAVNKDKTGAGDTYMTAFIKKYLEKTDLEQCGLYASAAASFCVEGFGTDFELSDEKVKERIEKGDVYE